AGGRQGSRQGVHGGVRVGHRQTVAVPDQPELTIQGWGPGSSRVATVSDDQDGPDGGRLDLTPDPQLDAHLTKAARRHLARELGWTPRATPVVPVAEIRLAPSRLPAE